MVKFLFTLHSFCQDEGFLDIWIFDVNDHLMFNIPNYHHIWFSRMFGLFWKCYVNLSSFSLGLWINGYSDVRIIRISKKERDYWIFYMQPSRSSISYSLIAFKYLGFQDFWIDLEVILKLDVLGSWILGYFDFTSLNTRISNLVHKLHFQGFLIFLEFFCFSKI